MTNYWKMATIPFTYKHLVTTKRTINWLNKVSHFVKNMVKIFILDQFIVLFKDIFRILWMTVNTEFVFNDIHKTRFVFPVWLKEKYIQPLRNLPPPGDNFVFGVWRYVTVVSDQQLVQTTVVVHRTQGFWHEA
jgi:hypothetical protein